MFNRGVRMFRQASCYFRSESDWEAKPVSFKLPVDRVSQSARFVTVPMGDRMASAIKCRFTFNEAWLMFSEVAFQSGEGAIEGLVGYWVLLFLFSSSFMVCLANI